MQVAIALGIVGSFNTPRHGRRGNRTKQCGWTTVRGNDYPDAFLYLIDQLAEVCSGYSNRNGFYPHGQSFAQIAKENKSFLQSSRLSDCWGTR